jgi:hypothetical protein
LNMPIDPSKVVWDAPDPAKVQWDDEPKQKDTGQRTLDQIGGLLRGAGSIGSTLIELGRSGGTRGQPFSTLLDRYKSRTSDMDAALDTIGADRESGGYKAMKLGTEVAGSLGAGSAVGGAMRGLPMLSKLAPAVESAGATGGNMLTRVAGGAISGGATAGLVDPSQAKDGAVIGGALPPALKVLGEAGRMTGRALSGPAQSPQLAASVKAARDVGYVIPPTQAKPTLGNRLLEGLAGKISTAQNASAMNAEVTNALAKKAIGAKDLSAEGLQTVRTLANQGYDDLAGVGTFQVDGAFRKALEGLQPKTLPGTKNADVSELIDALKVQQSFDAQETINTLKQLRFDGFANKAQMDPTKKALGNAQISIAKEMESLIERNLEKLGQPELLKNFRDSRQLLAKVHTVDKALNKESGNIDASVLKRALEKGKPLSGELKTIAEFASRFPKASQSVERMGSLPQTSPLDWAASGAIAAGTANPMGLLGVAARPLARGAALSSPVQNRLLQSDPELLELLSSPDLQAAVGRAAPGLLSGR